MPKKLSSIKNIANGKDKGLDTICEGIIEGSDFIYPYENL